MCHRIILSIALATCLCACGKSNETEKGDAAPSATPYEAAARVAEQQLESLQADNDREVYEPTVLKEMLPERLLGLERQSVASNSMGAAGFRMSTANATYQNEGETRRITVTITDGMGANLAAMGMVESFTVDKEEGSKTTKTMEVDGHQAIREYDTAGNSGSLTVIFDQSVVKLEGRGLSGVVELENAFGALPLRKL